MLGTAPDDPRDWLDVDQASLVQAMERVAEVGLDELAVFFIYDARSSAVFRHGSTLDRASYMQFQQSSVVYANRGAAPTR